MTSPISPIIIAEVAQGYGGSQELVEIYTKSAAAAGADAIKFQIFFADELALPDYKLYSWFKGLELPFHVWEKVIEDAHSSGLEFYSDVFGKKSLNKLEKCQVDGYKIHATDINNFRLLKVVAEKKKKVFLSTGGCSLPEIDKAVEILGQTDLALLYGFQAVPTPIKDINLGRISFLKNRYKIPVGFQDHTQGGTGLSFSLPFVAIGAGASIIEKHLTLSRIARTVDSISALTDEEFAAWAKEIKEATVSLGEVEWKLTKKEKQYRAQVRRAICSSRKINPGDTIQESDIIMKRTGETDAIFEISEVLGKQAKETIAENVLIRKVHFS